MRDRMTEARAALLVGALGTFEIPPSVVEAQLRVPAIHARVSILPISLDVLRFHYLVRRDGSVTPLHQHFRRCAHARTRRVP
jgi:hypothetical protein